MHNISVIILMMHSCMNSINKYDSFSIIVKLPELLERR